MESKETMLGTGPDYSQWHWICLGRELGRLCPRLLIHMPNNYNLLMGDIKEEVMRYHLENLVEYWLIREEAEGQLRVLRDAIRTKLSS